MYVQRSFFLTLKIDHRNFQPITHYFPTYRNVHLPKLPYLGIGILSVRSFERLKEKSLYSIPYFLYTYPTTLESHVHMST